VGSILEKSWNTIETDSSILVIPCHMPFKLDLITLSRNKSSLEFVNLITYVFRAKRFQAYFANSMIEWFRTFWIFSATIENATLLALMTAIAYARLRFRW
jgi:hypothetical protein